MEENKSKAEVKIGIIGCGKPSLINLVIKSLAEESNNNEKKISKQDKIKTLSYIENSIIK